MHVHIVQFDFHIRQIPFRGDRSPHTALPHLVEPPSACSIRTSNSEDASHKARNVIPLVCSAAGRSNTRGGERRWKT